MSSRRKLLIATGVLACGAFGGGAYAATSDTSPRQAFLSDVAKRLGVSPQKLTQALRGATIDQLNAEVKAGRLTQAQANAIEKGIGEPRAFGPPPFGLPSFGFRRPLLPGGGPFGAAASYVGISVRELLDGLAGGKSLAQIATAHGKSVSGLESALIAAQRSRLDQLRAHGFITRSQEQQLLSRMEAKIGSLVNQKGFGPGFFFDASFGRVQRLPMGPRFGRVGPPFPPGIAIPVPPGAPPLPYGPQPPGPPGPPPA